MYQCPNCGGGLRFDIPSQQLACDFCQTKLAPTHFDDLEGAQEVSEFEVTKFHCNQCGAEIVSPDNTAATFCSFCGSSTLLESRLSNERKPDAIIPFKKTKEDCIKAYQGFISKAIFAPKELKDSKCIDSFRGIYMPYWVYDFAHEGPFSITGTTSHREGDYDVTKYYDLNGYIDASYRGLTHDAEGDFADDISEALAPYDAHEMKVFNGSYLSGFYADIADVKCDTYKRDAESTAFNISFDAIRNEKHFSKYTIKKNIGPNSGKIPAFKTKSHYAMFPVWFMSYRKNDRVAYVTINGQTGKISADVPIDEKKYALGSLILALPIFVLLNFFLSLTAKTAMGFTAVLALCMMIAALVEMKKIAAKGAFAHDKGYLELHKQERVGKPKGIFTILGERIKARDNFIGVISAFFAIFLSLIMLIANPVSDYYYYGVAFVSIVSVLLSILEVIKDYNILSTRPLPQFNRTGGDDDAS